MMFAHCTPDENSCEKIFHQALLEAQTDCVAKGLSEAETRAYMLEVQDGLKANYTDCFPKQIQEEHKVEKLGLKLDSETLTDKQINRINLQYQSAEAECKASLEDEIKGFNKADKEKMIHECTMEKLVSMHSNIKG